MPIFRNSRYLSQGTIAVADEHDRVRNVYKQRDTTIFDGDWPANTRSISPTPGLSLDLIAREHLGSHRLWWLIADMNPEVFYPLDYDDGIGVAYGT